MKDVRIGVIGVGSMGSCHINSIKETPRVKLTAICDIDREHADNVGADNNVCVFYDGIEMIKSGEIDAVIIATPHYDHTPLTIAALENGIHTLCEKPIAVHKADAEKMVEASRKAPDVKFAAMFNQRTIKAHQKIKKLLDSGELGRIKRVNWIITNWFRSQRYYDSGGWRATWQGEGGGVLLNQCPHQLDLFQWFFGMPKTVRAFGAIGKYHKIEVEDDVTAYCEFENGATGVFITSTGEAPGTNRLEIVCDRGRLVFENGIEFIRTEDPVQEFCDTTDSRFGIPENWKIEIPAEEPAGSQHQRIIQNFVNAILDDVDLIANGVEGINSVEFGNSMLYSVMKNTTVDLPLDGNAYAEMLQELIEKSTFEKNETVDTVDKNFASSF